MQNDAHNMWPISAKFVDQRMSMTMLRNMITGNSDMCMTRLCLCPSNYNKVVILQSDIVVHIVNCSPKTNTSSRNSSRTPKLPWTKLGIQMIILMVQPCEICIPLLPQGEHHIRIGGNSILHHNLLVVAIGTVLGACRASGFIIFRGRNWRAVDDIEPSCWSPWDSTQVFVSYFPCSLHTANTWVPLLLAYFYPGLPSWGYW